MEVHLRDLRHYAQNVNEAGEAARRHVKVSLRAAAKTGRRVLLLAHSMGSVIAWDALWQLSRDTDYDGRIDLLMTLGSPLGQRYIQQRVLGAEKKGADRFPGNIVRWINIAAVGELTALDRHVADNFRDMLQLRMVQSIEDIEVFNWFRYNGILNVHAEYGYLANRETATHIADWWRRHQ
jgi:pimeloyl-ACP methyl ester carboxylesterase